MMQCVACLNCLLPILLFTNKIKYITKNPYARLMRLDKLTGFWLALIPAFISILLGAKTIAHPIYIVFIFIIGALSARSAGCIINDIIDKKFDQKVERTKLRPLASGELNKLQAIVMCLILGMIAFAALIALPATSIKIGLFSLLLIIVYPLAKRYMRAPQLMLGLVMNLGVFIAWFAVSDHFSLVPVFVYVASIFWTIGYDTIYAIQDKKYDKKLDINSTALLFGDSQADFVWRVYKFYLMLYFVRMLQI